MLIIGDSVYFFDCVSLNGSSVPSNSHPDLKFGTGQGLTPCLKIHVVVDGSEKVVRRLCNRPKFVFATYLLNLNCFPIVRSL